MTTHSSVPAWEGPWTEEPGGLQSVGPKSRTPLTRSEEQHLGKPGAWTQESGGAVGEPQGVGN